MAQSRSTKIISMIKWIWTSRLSIKNSLFGQAGNYGAEVVFDSDMSYRPLRVANLVTCPPELRGNTFAVHRVGDGASKKQHPPRTLQWENAQGSMVVLGGGAVSSERGNPCTERESPLLTTYWSKST